MAVSPAPLPPGHREELLTVEANSWSALWKGSAAFQRRLIEQGSGKPGVMLWSSSSARVRLLRVAGWGLGAPNVGGLWPAASWEQMQGTLNSCADLNPCE